MFKHFIQSKEIPGCVKKFSEEFYRYFSHCYFDNDDTFKITFKDFENKQEENFIDLLIDLGFENTTSDNLYVMTGEKTVKTGEKIIEDLIVFVEIYYDDDELTVKFMTY